MAYSSTVIGLTLFPVAQLIDDNDQQGHHHAAGGKTDVRTKTFGEDTGKQAAEQGREVFAVPGPITSRMSEGVNKLIKEGLVDVTKTYETFIKPAAVEIITQFLKK